MMLSGRAQKILQRQIEAHEGDWVFPNPDGWPYTRNLVSKHFHRAARAAGLRDFHFHDLRQHGATMAINANFSAPIVQALGGWKTERMMRRYAAVTDPTPRAAAEPGFPPRPSVFDLFMTGTREPGVFDRFPCQDDAEAEDGVLGGTCDHDEQCIRIRRGLGRS